MNINVLPKFEPQAKPAPAIIPVPPRVVCGVSLAHRLSGKSPVERAFLGADLHSGRLHLKELTLKQAAAITGANTSYVSAAVKLAYNERYSVRAGMRPMIEVPAARQAVPPKSDDEVLADLVARNGTDRVLEMLIGVGVAVAA